MLRSLTTIVLVASALAAGGCHSWTHAPGHAQRETMKRTEMPWVAGELCSYGWCDLEGPDGEIEIADVHVEGVSDARTATRFKVRYRGAQADCVHPAPDGNVLSCAIADGAAQPAVQTLEVERGCTAARLSAVDGTDGAPSLNLFTDVVEVLGVESPAREISLVDREGVRAFTDAPGMGLVLFTRPAAPVENKAVVAMVAYHAFLDMDGKVPQCMTGAPTLAKGPARGSAF